MPFDITQIVADLEQVGTDFHTQFDTAEVPDNVAQFDAHLATLQMVVEQTQINATNQETPS